jgi:hypothetical protein
MPEITTESQRELRAEIEKRFGELLIVLMNQYEAYKLCAELNKDFTSYAGNAQILTENKTEKEYTPL